jgi:hypothetical protein
MEDNGSDGLRGMLSSFIQPWYDALKDPTRAQASALSMLLEGYSKTGYGKSHGAGGLRTGEEFKRAFPVCDYEGFRPYIDRVREGDHEALLPEEALGWVMTRGTTGKSKVIPVTQTHMDLILFLGARGIVNHALRKPESGVLGGHVLNLNFPSEVNRLRTAMGEEAYGYSSGTYAKFNPQFGGTRLVPKQEEIDALGGGIGRANWEARFELVYKAAKDQRIKSVMGVTPVITAFGRYIKGRHGRLPRDIWQMGGLFCTSVAKIHTNYAPALRKLYGDADVVELYTATEGAFGQQLDDNPYFSPNYDVYFFEVATGKGVKMLHEMRAGEWGKLIISGPLFPRYDMGDLVECAGKGYYRVFGRNTFFTVVEHRLFSLITGRAFGI